MARRKRTAGRKTCKKGGRTKKKRCCPYPKKSTRKGGRGVHRISKYTVPGYLRRLPKK